MHTPETGDDALEEFIDHHPNDCALPAIFARLDELYRMERKPSTNELERWVHDPAQPRQALAQWYFARSALRSGDREKAIELLTQLRDSPAAPAVVRRSRSGIGAPAPREEEWEAAIAAAEAGRAQDSAPAFPERVDWLIAEANYRSGHLERLRQSMNNWRRSARTFRQRPLQRGALLAAARSRRAVCRRLSQDQQRSRAARRAG